MAAPAGGMMQTMDTSSCADVCDGDVAARVTTKAHTMKVPPRPSTHAFLKCQLARAQRAEVSMTGTHWKLGWRAHQRSSGGGGAPRG